MPSGPWCGPSASGPPSPAPPRTASAAPTAGRSRRPAHALALDETHEASYRQLMRALVAAGERGEALRVWERCRIALVEELGIDPSPETEALYLEVLDPGAAAPAPSTALPSGVVTFLLTDIVGSTALWDDHPAEMDAALERHDRIVADVVAAHEGTLLKSKLEGDATVSVFARATACATAALALLDALAAEAWPESTAPRVRMAMHTGEAFERGGDYFGPALNRAARLRSLAGPDQVLLSQAVAELVRDHLPDDVVLSDLGYRDLRGLSRGENVFALARGAGAEPRRAPPARSAPVAPPLPSALVSGGPFVGRAGEVAELDRLWQDAVAGHGRAVFVGGEPGVGKSRLAAELAATAHARGWHRALRPLRRGPGCAAPAVRRGAAHPRTRRSAPTRLRAVRGAEELARVVPEVGELLPVEDGARRADPESERLALFDAVTTAAARRGGGGADPPRPRRPALGRQDDAVAAPARPARQRGHAAARRRDLPGHGAGAQPPARRHARRPPPATAPASG